MRERAREERQKEERKREKRRFPFLSSFHHFFLLHLWVPTHFQVDRVNFQSFSNAAPPCFTCAVDGFCSAAAADARACRAGVRDSGDRSSPPCFRGEMSSEKPVSVPPGSASSLTDTDRESHPPAGSSTQQPPPPQQQVAAGSGTTGERMVSAAGSMVLPAGVINPAVPIRNIQMKFAVLVGLIQVGEVSNRDIVETVLNLVSGSRTEQSWKTLKGSHRAQHSRCAPTRYVLFTMLRSLLVVWLSGDDVICLFERWLIFLFYFL